MTDTPAKPGANSGSHSGADQTRIRVAELSHRKPHRFDIVPDRPICDQIAQQLVIRALRKLRFAGTLRALGKHDWQLDATLAASAEQACVRTLAPVTTRITVTVTRRFVRDWVAPDESDEMEMPEDVNTEAIPAEIDLIAILSEELALALPDYPKAEGADQGPVQIAPEGATPLRDTDMKPFAALAALKDKLGKPDT